MLWVGMQRTRLRRWDVTKIGKQPLGQPTSVLLAMLALLALAVSWEKAQTFWGIDYYQFWVVGQAVGRSDAKKIYSEAERKRIGLQFLHEAREAGASQRQIQVARYRVNLENYSTPFLYTALHAFCSGDYEADLGRHRAISLACMVLAVLGICKMLGFSHAATLAMLLACIVLFDPFLSEMRVANVNTLQLGLLSLFLWMQRAFRVPRHQWLAGLVLGLTVMFKPNLALVAILLPASWVINRRYQKLLMESFGFLVGVLAALAWSSLFFGSAKPWLDWLAAVRSMPAEVMPVETGNYAPLMLIPGGSGTRESIALGFVLALLVLAFVWISRRCDEAAGGAKKPGEAPDREFLEDVLVVGAGCLVYLLSAPLVWQHYFLLAVPTLVLSFRPTPTPSPARTSEVLARRILPALALLALSATPIWTPLPLSHEEFYPVAHGLASLTLYGLALWQLWCLREVGRQTGPHGSSSAPAAQRRSIGALVTGRHER